MTCRMARLFSCFGAVVLAWLVSHDPAWAQAHNPFSVGISEGGGSASGISGWLLAKQSGFEQLLSGAVRASKANGSALWFLSGLSFLYGVFHAAGPGHGKAVVASYMFANERALRRGVIISFLAAALQGLVAILLVGVLALVFHSTAQHMKDAARIVESLSYAGIAALGLWLIWRKSGAFFKAWRSWLASRGSAGGAPVLHKNSGVVGAVDHEDVHACSGHDHAHDRDPAHGNAAHPVPERPARVHHDHVHGPDCGHFHAPDPRTLGGRFSWTSAGMTVVAAGLRPCSGAILVLVFALAQGLFIAGVYATLAMSLGTALTTSGLATLAVLAGNLAVKISGRDSPRGELIVRGIEACAGVFILLLGLGLFFGVNASTGA